MLLNTLCEVINIEPKDIAILSTLTGNTDSLQGYLLHHRNSWPHLIVVFASGQAKLVDSKIVNRCILTMQEFFCPLELHSGHLALFRFIAYVYLSCGMSKINKTCKLNHNSDRQYITICISNVFSVFRCSFILCTI